MNVKILSITLLLLSTFASSQITTKVAFQNFKDSCNKEIGMQYQRKNYDDALKTLTVAQKAYDNLDVKLKKELNLDGKFYFNRASIYASKSNIELTEKYLNKAIQYKFKDIGSLYYDVAGVCARIQNEKMAVYFLKKAVNAGFNNLDSWHNLICIPNTENIDFNNELIKLGEKKKLSTLNNISLPWHIIDIRTELKKNIKLDKLEIDFSILSDVPKDLNLYIAPLGYGRINNHGFYGGIQTKIHGTGKPGLIFSRWDERDTAAIQTDSTGYKCSSGNEGDFISVRKKYNWTKGQYRITLKANPDTLMLKGKVHRWVAMSIYSYDKKEEVINGSLAFPGDTLMLGKELWIFVEIYGGSRPNIGITELPEMRFSFDRFVVNGIEQVEYGESIYFIEKPKYAEAYFRDGKIWLTANKKVTHIDSKLKQGHYIKTLFEERNR
jgi:tetratricopeptide (TPR) repeat protein